MEKVISRSYFRRVLDIKPNNLNISWKIGNKRTVEGRYNREVAEEPKGRHT